MTKLIFIIKAHAPIPPDAHWITVNSGGGKGQPVLIQPQADGSAKVIGGAGGALNHLRLRNVKSHSDYKSEAGERAADTRKKKKEQVKQDKEAGVHEAKQQAKADIQKQKKEAEHGVIQAVGKKAGWSSSEMTFDESAYPEASEKALAKLKDRHHANLLKKAKDFISQAKEKLVNDAAGRKDAGIGELPLFSEEPDAISVADIAPVPKQAGGLGFNANYKERAEQSGLTEEGLAAEAQQVKQGQLGELTDDQRAAAFARKQSHEILKHELAGLQEPPAPNADASLLDAKDALEMVKLGKRLADIEKQARAANSDMDKKAAEPKAFILEASEDTDLDAAARAAVVNDLRTIQTSAFLSGVGEIAGANPLETLGGHIGVGAYNSINSLALAVGGEALVDRSVVDVIGIAGAAQVLARRLQNDLSPAEMMHVSDGMQDWHISHYMKTGVESLKKAKDLTDAAKAIELSDHIETGDDLAMAQELNAKRRNAIGDAQRILGQALGEMEANAALVVALKQKASDTFQVSLGKTSPEQAIKQIRAIGLQPGDYELEKVAGDTFLTLNAGGLDRLAKPVNRDDVQQVSRNLSIIRGDHDENGWLPLGVANRPDLVMDVPAGVAEQLAKPFDVNAPEGMESALKAYIGGRTADGDPPADILADIQSADFFQKVSDPDAYRAALDAVAPLKGQDGNMQRIESLGQQFESYADDYVASLGGERSTLSRQKFDVNQNSVDALHRALSATPEGVSAYKQIGDLTNKDQSALRDFFHKNIAKESPESGQLRQDLEKMTANEPEKTTTDMFGEESENPEWKDWKSSRDALAEKVNSSSLTWGKYIKSMGGNARAYAAVQDLIKSKIANDFVTAHNKLNPSAPLKIGKTIIRHNLEHLDAVDPAASEARLAKQRSLIDGMRERNGGAYASGSVADKLAQAKEQQAAFEQSQMSFFSSEEAPKNSADLGDDERHTLGHAAERQIAGMMGQVGKNFKPGQPTKLWGVSMSGKYAPQQRAIKLMTANKRMVLAAGAGSGKTNMMLGAHAHLSGLGKVKRSIMIVPSIVQGQFNGEALRLLEAGKFKTHIQPGASQAERIAAYKDPDTHICVMTHQSFRDDMIHLASKHAGISEREMVDNLQGMNIAERKRWAADTMAKEGIKFDASFVDEAHDTLNRAGKENSSMANVIEAVGHNTPYHTYASGDPIKNDPSEIFSMLQKMDPERYSEREAFMRRYGADTIASKQALKREMARYMFPTSISPDVQVTRRQEKVDLSAGQKTAMAELSGNLAKARLARRAGKIDIDAAKAISPNSFKNVPEDQHEKIADGIQKSLGIIKSSAMNRIINSHPDNAKVNHAVDIVAQRPGKQGVIFARNRESVQQYKEAMEKAGKRVVTITGSDSSKEKDAKRRMFNPESGEATADILIASDAGAVGMNLQSGQYLIQHDTPATAKTHSQRAARIDRIGQKQAIELFDLQANHPEEVRARARLEKKYDLKNMMADPMDGLDDTGVAGAIAARRHMAQNDESVA